MSDTPAISVIMPVYNTEETLLRQAIESVLNQTFQNFEFLIINDESSNNSEDVILSYEDTRIKYLFQLQSGQSKARNNALRHAKGEYIFYIDADDWIEPKALEHTYKKSQENSLDILLFGTFAHNFQTKEISDWSGELSFFADENVIMSGKDKLLQECLFVMNQACWGKLFNKEFLLKNNLFFAEGLIFEDLDILFRYMLKAQKVGVLKENLYHYNVNVENSTTAVGNKKHFNLVKIFELVEKTLIETNTFEDLKIKFYDLKLLLYGYRYDRIHPDIKEEFKTLLFEDLKNTKLNKREMEKLQYKNEFLDFLINQN